MRRTSLLFFLCFSMPAAAFKGPTPPKVPVVKGTSSTNTNSTWKQPGSKTGNFTVRFTLGNGKTVSGTVVLKTVPMTIRHTVEGIEYTRTVEFSGVRSIRILRWGGVRGSSTQSGGKLRTLYYFVPVAWSFRLADGRTFVYRKRLRMLERLIISNRYGRAYIYGYFADYWVGRGYSGYWSGSGERKFAVERTESNPSCYVRMSFIPPRRRR